VPTATTGTSRCIIFDLDDFKAINDRIGHSLRRCRLAEAAERIRDVVRSADIACRVGGRRVRGHPPGVEAPGR
jgi:diguanylate cyclase (GGDEF)-like protein